MILYLILLTGTVAAGTALLHPRPQSQETARLLAIGVALIALLHWDQW